MKRVCASIILLALALTASPVLAQYSLEHRPLDPAIDPDIDMFFGDWRESIPYNIHGTITARAILTKLEGDPVFPTKRSAVLQHLNGFYRATLEAWSYSTPSILEGEQEVYYVHSGKGIITGAGDTFDLHNGIFVLVPEGVEFAMENTGAEPLVMYLIVEPTDAGFTPKRKLVVKNEHEMPYRDQGYLGVHWAHNGKNVFSMDDGLCELERVNLITFNAMTVGQPHAHVDVTEEMWCVVDGKNLEMLGKEIRWMGEGECFKIPPNGKVPHSHINPGDDPMKFLYFARFRDKEDR
jgi:mannose-6-phosphate isomerase-like protein (cupin superfamily)